MHKDVWKITISDIQSICKTIVYILKLSKIDIGLKIKSDWRQSLFIFTITQQISNYLNYHFGWFRSNNKCRWEYFEEQPPSRLPLTKPWIFDASCAFAICCIQTSRKEKIVWNNATLPGLPVIIIKATECVESLIWLFHHNIHVYEFDIKLFRKGMLKGTE